MLSLPAFNVCWFLGFFSVLSLYAVSTIFFNNPFQVFGFIQVLLYFLAFQNEVCIWVCSIYFLLSFQLLSCLICPLLLQFNMQFQSSEVIFFLCLVYAYLILNFHYICSFDFSRYPWEIFVSFSSLSFEPDRYAIYLFYVFGTKLYIIFFPFKLWSLFCAWFSIYIGFPFF